MSEDTPVRLPEFARRYRWFLVKKPQYAASIAHVEGQGADERRLFSIVSPERLGRILGKVLDQAEFLSDHGIRALAACHRDEPFTIALGSLSATVDYEPGESTTGLLGGNSNWRGPVWFPVHSIILEALRRFALYFDGDLWSCRPARGTR